MTNSLHSKHAGWFLLVGVIMTYGLMFLMTANGPFAGAGDGAGLDEGPSPKGLVLPYSAYFVCGIVAACSGRRWLRIIAAVVAHTAPFGSFLFVNFKEVHGFLWIELITFAVFGFAWFQILKKQ